MGQVDKQKKFLLHSTGVFTSLIMDFAKAKLEGSLTKENMYLEKLQTLLRETLILSNLIGRRFTYRKAVGKRGRNEPLRKAVVLASDDTPVFPGMSFLQALDDLLGRKIKVVSAEAQAMRRGYIEVQEMYARGHVFALARSVSDKITSKIQKVIETHLQGKKGRYSYREDPAQIIADMGNWSRAYGEVVYRTNMATSMVQGIKQMATDPDIEDLIGGFQYSAVGDVDTRHNHQAASGLIAGTRDPIWKVFTPPLGYNCRCTLVMVDKYEMREKGLLENGRVNRFEPPSFSDAHPDPGFPGYQK